MITPENIVPHQYITTGPHTNRCRSCDFGRLASCHYEDARTPEELDRALFLEIRRGMLYVVRAIEKRFDLTAATGPAVNSQQNHP